MNHRDIEGRRATAVHEAGHAVIGWRYGLILREEGVYISDDGRQGLADLGALATPDEVSYLPPCFKATFVLRAEAQVIIFLAGNVAEGRFEKIKLGENILIPGKGCINPNSDLRRVQVLLQAITGRERNSFFQWMLQNTTQRQIQDPRTWAAILDMAEKLVQHGHLTAEECEAIPVLYNVPRAQRRWESKKSSPEIDQWIASEESLAQEEVRDWVDRCRRLAVHGRSAFSPSESRYR
jgi:hypothetical protein